MSYLGNSPGVASQRVESALTATAAQTVFTPSSGYTLGYCDVYQNGVKLVNGDDYTAANGTTITLTTGAAVGDSIVIVASFPRGLSDGYLKSEADAKYLTIANPTASGNLTFTGTGNRIIADFTNATIANRVMFQTSTTNGQTSIGVMPNGTSAVANLNLFGGTDPANAAIAQLVNTGSEARFAATITGTGTYLPMTFYAGGSERIRVVGGTGSDVGNVGIGITSPLAKLHINGGSTFMTGPSSGTFGLSLYTTRASSSARSWAIKTNENAEGDFVILRSTTNTDAPSVASATLDNTGNLSVDGFQLKLGNSGNSTVSILRGARPGVGSAGVSIYAGASSTVNDAAPAAYITLSSGALGDTYEGSIGYHAYGNTTGSGYQNAHTWYRRTGTNAESVSMQLDPGGNLGVGVTPQSISRLDVIAVGSSESNAGLQVRSFAAGTSDGSTTVTAVRAVSGNASFWANTKYHAYSHQWGVGSSASTSVAMTLDAAGRVTKPFQPRFRVGSSGDNTTYGNDAILKMVNNEYDPVGCYDPSTGRFTAPVAGFYHFDYVVRLDNLASNYGQYIRVRPHKNGAHMEWLVGDAINPVVIANGVPYMHMQQSFSAELASGDYIDLRLGWGAGGASSIALSNSGWSGYLIA